MFCTGINLTQLYRGKISYLWYVTREMGFVNKMMRGLARPDADLALRGIDRGHVALVGDVRLAGRVGRCDQVTEPAMLTDGEVVRAVVATEHRAVVIDDRARHRQRTTATQRARADEARVVAVGDEADFLRLVLHRVR